MTQIQNTTPYSVGTDQAYCWLRYQPSDKSWCVEAFARCPGGIMYLLESYEGERPPSTDLVIRAALERGHFSPRPYRLNGDTDPSMSHCVLALLCQFCRERKFDLQEVFDHAEISQPRLTKTDLAFVVLQGFWEGVVVPDQWSNGAVDALIDALFEVGYEDLAGVVGRKVHPNALI